MTKHPASTRAALAAAFLFMLIAVLVQLGFTRTLDEAILRWVLAGRTPVLTGIMVAFTTLAGGVVLPLRQVGKQLEHIIEVPATELAGLLQPKHQVLPHR